MKLSSLFKTIGLLALIATPAVAGTSAKAPAPVAPPPAEEDNLGVTLGVGYDSHLIFRGVQYGENWLSSSLGIAIPLVDNISFDLDANYGSLADDQDALLGGLSYQRLELGAGVTADLGAAEVGVAYRWYHHMGDLDAILHDGHEVGLTVASSAGPVNFGLGGYYDFESEGWYFEAAVNTEIKINDMISIVPGVGIGYAVDYDWHVDGGSLDGFTAVNLSLAVPVKLTKNVTLTPYIAGNLPIDALDDAGEPDQLYGGVSLSVKF